MCWLLRVANGAALVGMLIEAGAACTVGELAGPELCLGSIAANIEVDGELIAGDGAVAVAEGDSELVNLASEGRTTHLLQGDETGGGHLWPGTAGKTPFPQSWSEGRIMHAISDIATDPAAWANAVQQGSRTVLVGSRDGVEIRVIVDGNGEIITVTPSTCQGTRNGRRRLIL
jgi:hypothetical protein